MIIANRKSEIELFNKMVNRNMEEKILLIRSESGFGKSYLLKHFKDSLSTNIPCILMALKTANMGILSIFHYTIRCLGVEKFPSLSSALNNYRSNSGVEVSNTTMLGRDNQLRVELSYNNDELTRRLRLIELQEKFFEDLRKISKTVVLLFDSYEEAPSEVKDWLGGDFLTQVAHAEKLIVVIAGQTIPKPTIEWVYLSKQNYLEAILDTNTWYNYSKEAGLHLKENDVEIIMLVLKGIPFDVVPALEMIAKRKNSE